MILYINTLSSKTKVETKYPATNPILHEYWPMNVDFILYFGSNHNFDKSKII